MVDTFRVSEDITGPTVLEFISIALVGVVGNSDDNSVDALGDSTVELVGDSGGGNVGAK